MSTKRPRLVNGVRLVEQVFQGEPGYVVRSPQTGAYLRFRPAEAQVIREFTGDRSAADIALALAREGLKLSADAIDAFAVRLASLGLVEQSLAERSSAQLERLRQERKERRRKPLFRGELMRLRIPFADPDRWLTATLPYVRWCFTRGFVLASLIAFASYAGVMLAYGGQVTSEFARVMDPRTLSIGTVLLFWGIFISIGTIHELGHAYACKAFSGQVNEMGFMVLYFQPAFYCNVNDAWTFPALRHRLWVTAAGGWIELWVAVAAVAVWLMAAPGSWIATVAVTTSVLAGGLTLISNANPLLPYDGYFALSDWLDIPNLRQRASAYTRWFMLTRFLARDEAEPEVTDRERRIFLWYGFLSRAYILFATWFLLRIVLGWIYDTFGALECFAALALLLLWQRERLVNGWASLRELAREVHRRFVAPQLRRIPAPLRGMRSFALAALLVLLLPWSKTVDGQWTAQPVVQVVHVAPLDGVIAEIVVHEGDAVMVGAPLLRVDNRLMNRVAPSLMATRDSLTQLAMQARAQNANTELFAASARAAGERADNMRFAQRAGTLRAAIAGRVLTRDPDLLLGRSVTAGAPLVAIGRDDSLEVRVRLVGAGAPLVREGQTVSLMLDADAAHPLRATVGSVSRVADAHPDAHANASERSSERSDERSGALEARVWIASTSTWRAGTRGPARVVIDGGTVGGALLWAVRSRLRADLLL